MSALFYIAQASTRLVAFYKQILRQLCRIIFCVTNNRTWVICYLLVRTNFAKFVASFVSLLNPVNFNLSCSAGELHKNVQSVSKDHQRTVVNRREMQNITRQTVLVCESQQPPLLTHDKTAEVRRSLGLSRSPGPRMLWLFSCFGSGGSCDCDMSFGFPRGIKRLA